MKKKIFTFVLSFCLMLPCVFVLSACGHEHTFEEEWTFNDTHHWHVSTCEHSEEISDYSEHVDENLNNVCDVCNYGAVALVGDVCYNNIAEAIENANDKTVVLVEDIELTTGVNIWNNVTLDLNGKTITATYCTSSSVLRVETGAKLTINGEGTINSASQANDYSMAVWARNGGEVVINGGIFTNVGAKDYEDNGTTPNNNELIYASGGGSITINGGTFIGNYENEKWGTRYALNLKDNDGSTILVKGGEFHKYNPSKSLSENPQADFVHEDYIAEKIGDVYRVRERRSAALINDVEYHSLEEAVESVGASETIVINEHIDLETKITIDKTVTIDLNNFSISVSNDTAGDGVFMVVEGGDLTICGEGEVNGVGNNPWNIVIFANGGNVTINGGTYTNVGAVDTGSANGGDAHFDVIYAKNGGTVTINGGTFKGQTPNWILNKHDSTRNDCSIEVKGGTFYGFNPADNLAEGEGTNFVAEGYTVQENNGVYTVVAE